MLSSTKGSGRVKEMALEAEEEIARSDALFHSIGDGAIATDENGYIEKVNHVAQKLLGMREKDLIGHKFLEALPSLDDKERPIPDDQRPLTKAMERNQTISSKCYYKRPDGSTVPVAVTVSPIILDGQSIGAIEVFRDITRELEVDRMKTEFISIASHQLRTPATAIKTYTSMILDGYAGELSEKQLEFIRLAHDSNERQLRIVNDLLSVANLESNSLVMKRRTINLTGLIKDMAETFKGIINNRKQTLKLDLDEDVIITVDSSYLRMVLENLISNASKYTEEGGKITVKLKEVGKTVKLSVSDTGIGIAPEDYDKLFKKFSRLENPSTGHVSGSGIGLYLAKQIIDMHDGTIEVQPVDPKGTCFLVTLPK